MALFNENKKSFLVGKINIKLTKQSYFRLYMIS